MTMSPGAGFDEFAEAPDAAADEADGSPVPERDGSRQSDGPVTSATLHGGSDIVTEWDPRLG